MSRKPSEDHQPSRHDRAKTKTVGSTWFDPRPPHERVPVYYTVHRKPWWRRKSVEYIMLAIGLACLAALGWSKMGSGGC